ncbi:MAG: hypothetical protein ABL903_05415 [Methylococcales bacterium]
MIKFNLKPLVIAVSLGALSMNVSAGQLKTTKAVIKGNDTAVISITHDTPVQGDQYLATEINGKLAFFGNKGKSITSHPIPFLANTVLEGEIKALEVNAGNIPADQYPVFAVVTNPGTDPLDFGNWIGGLGALSHVNIAINMPDALSNDKDGDGFSDDDDDHDGYHNTDGNHDGIPDECKKGKRKASEKPRVTPTPVKHDDHEDEDEDDVNCGPTTTPTPSVTPTPTKVPPTATPTPTKVPPTATPTPTKVPPTATPTPTKVPPTATPTPTKVPPTATPSPTPTATPSPTPTATPSPTPPPLDGAALYTTNCAGCHGTSKKGSSASSIQSAINSNKGGMGSLKGLTSAEIAAIAAAK